MLTNRLAMTYELSERERQIVYLTVLGVSRAELGVMLGTNENTLKSAIRRLLRKCDEKNLEGVVRLALEELLDDQTEVDLRVRS